VDAVSSTIRMHTNRSLARLELSLSWQSGCEEGTIVHKQKKESSLLRIKPAPRLPTAKLKGLSYSLPQLSWASTLLYLFPLSSFLFRWYITRKTRHNS
jgi:hypothetical protein